MTTWKEQVSNDHAKSMRLLNLSKEIKLIRNIAKAVLKEVRNQPKSEITDTVEKQAKFLMAEAKKLSKQARRFHMLAATPEVVVQLDEFVEVVKRERIETERMFKSLL